MAQSWIVRTEQRCVRTLQPACRARAIAAARSAGWKYAAMASWIWARNVMMAIHRTPIPAPISAGESAYSAAMDRWIPGKHASAALRMLPAKAERSAAAMASAAPHVPRSPVITTASAMQTKIAVAMIAMESRMVASLDSCAIARRIPASIVFAAITKLNRASTVMYRCPQVTQVLPGSAIPIPVRLSTPAVMEQRNSASSAKRLSHSADRIAPLISVRFCVRRMAQDLWNSTSISHRGATAWMIPQSMAHPIRPLIPTSGGHHRI